MSDSGLLELSCMLGINFLDNVDKILSIIGTVVIVGIAVINFILKLKNYSKDGKIDANEAKDLLNDVNEIANKIKESKNE